MSDLYGTERVIPGPATSATDGQIVVEPVRTIWLAAHGVGAFIGVLVFPSWQAAVVFVALTAVTICAGHSVGMHRLLIHRSFRAPKYIEYVLVWLGTLVGMAGPMGMIRAHDMRDWHQRQLVCPPHPSHGAGFWRDAWWQLCCKFQLKHPPELKIEAEVATDPIYRWMERTWMAQQIPVAVVLFAMGGWGFVLWGICLRVFVSLVGHWMVGHFAHRGGEQGWRIDGLPVQGYNLRGLGAVTFGESFHGNHHAFPHSAKLGVERGQFDPGYIFIRMLAILNLAHDIKLPKSEPNRPGLMRVQSGSSANRNSLTSTSGISQGFRIAVPSAKR
ncbi:MAG: acyl-CoA desaturase [Pseudomonadota bacterium]